MKTAEFHPKPAFDSDITNVPKMLTNLTKLERRKKEPCRDAEY
jgi:hypothetical protein